MKLTDEQIDDLERTDNSFATITGAEMRALVREVRELRALLATPLDCGWPVPVAELKFKGTPYVSWDVEENGEPSLLKPDEAKALGAALIRAALTAEGESK